MCNEIEGSHDKIIITIVPSYTKKKNHSLLLLALLLMLRTRNNTDGNKLVIFSGIALYYGDTYIVLRSGITVVLCKLCTLTVCNALDVSDVPDAHCLQTFPNLTNSCAMFTKKTLLHFFGAYCTSYVQIKIKM